MTPSEAKIATRAPCDLEGVMQHYLRNILKGNLRWADFLNRLRREAELFALPADD